MWWKDRGVRRRGLGGLPFYLVVVLSISTSTLQLPANVFLRSDSLPLLLPAFSFSFKFFTSSSSNVLLRPDTLLLFFFPPPPSPLGDTLVEGQSSKSTWTLVCKVHWWRRAITIQNQEDVNDSHSFLPWLLVILSVSFCCFFPLSGPKFFRPYRLQQALFWSELSSSPFLPPHFAWQFHLICTQFTKRQSN